MTQFIRQLTGVRLIAAVWVLMYHFQAPLEQLNLLVPVLSDVVRVGRLGVDLFFALSGFILAHTYLEKLGPRLKVRASGRFYWLRLARIYPVHFLMLNVAGLAVLAQVLVGRDGAADRDWLNPIDYLKNVFLVQEWGPNPQRGWNFPAWSLSMEWIAYLLFPLLALVLWRLHRRVATGWLLVGWVLVLAPLLAYGIGFTADPYYIDGWGSTLRVLTEFTAGALTYLVVRRLAGDGERPRDRVERLATTLSVAMPVLIVVGAVVLCRVPSWQWPAGLENSPPRYHLLLVPPLIIWIGALALSRRGLARWCATDVMLLGGYISYSLYMTHTVWYGLWRAGLDAANIEGGVLFALATIALFAGAFLIAYVVWKWVEEPAREWMRKAIGTRAKPVEEQAPVAERHSAS